MKTSIFTNYSFYPTSITASPTIFPLSIRALSRDRPIHGRIIAKDAIYFPHRQRPDRPSPIRPSRAFPPASNRQVINLMRGRPSRRLLIHAQIQRAAFPNPPEVVFTVKARLVGVKYIDLVTLPLFENAP